MTNRKFARVGGFVGAALLAIAIIFAATPGRAHGGFDAWQELGADGRMAYAQNGAQAYAPKESEAAHGELASEMLACMDKRIAGAKEQGKFVHETIGVCWRAAIEKLGVTHFDELRELRSRNLAKRCRSKMHNVAVRTGNTPKTLHYEKVCARAELDYVRNGFTK